MDESREYIAAVREYARKHYKESGWDIIVDYYSDEMIGAAIRNTRTLNGAINRIKAVVKVNIEVESEALQNAS